MTVDGPRAARPHELGPVVDLANLVFFHAHGRAPRIATFHPELFTEANRENVRLLRVDGRVVSALTVFPLPVRCVGPHGPVRLLVGCIGTVITHADYRRHGFGRAVLRDALAHMREIGCEFGWLGTGIPAFYRALGWENAGSAYSFQLDRSHVELLPTSGDLDLSCSPDGDAGVVTALGVEASLGSLRDATLTQVRLEHPGREVWVARHGSAAIAYVVVDGDDNGDKAIEHAGPAEAVAAILGAWWRTRDDPAASASGWGRGSANRTLQVTAPDLPGGLADHLLTRGFPHRRGYQGMLRAVRPTDLLRELGCDAVAIEEDDGASVSVRAEAASCRLTHGQFARWVFGPEVVPGAPPVRCSPGGAWPARFHLSPLDHV